MYKWTSVFLFVPLVLSLVISARAQEPKFRHLLKPLSKAEQAQVSVADLRLAAQEFARAYFYVYTFEYSKARNKESAILPATILDEINIEIQKTSEKELRRQQEDFYRDGGRQRAIAALIQNIDAKARAWEKSHQGYENKRADIKTIVAARSNEPYTPEQRKFMFDFAQGRVKIEIPKGAHAQIASQISKDSPISIWILLMGVGATLIAGLYFFFLRFKTQK